MKSKYWQYAILSYASDDPTADLLEWHKGPWYVDI